MRQVALARPAPGQWALVQQPALGPLPSELADRLRAPAGPPGALRSAVLDTDGTPSGAAAPDALYRACLDAALVLVAERLEDESVREAPRSSGILALRLRTDGADALLDLAPARDEQGWLGRSARAHLAELRLDGREGWSAAGPPDVTFGAAPVTAGGRTIEVPCATARWRRPGTTAAALAVTLPPAWLPGVPEPVIAVTLRA